MPLNNSLHTFTDYEVASYIHKTCIFTCVLDNLLLEMWEQSLHPMKLSFLISSESSQLIKPRTNTIHPGTASQLPAP